MNIAILGCGTIARIRHAPAVAAHPKATLYAVCAPGRIHADELAAAYGTRAVYDPERIIRDENVDAVIVCTPERTHCEQVIAALEAGKDVLCEKPLAMNGEEGRTIIRAWEKSGKRLMVAFGQRLTPEHVLARDLLAKGVIGRPTAFHTALTNRGVEYAAISGPSPDFYDRKLADVGDVLLSVGCHRIDLVSCLFGTRIVAVSALTPVIDKRYADGRPIDGADHAMITVEMRGGPVGTIWTSWCDYGWPERSTVIYGTEGAMSIFEGPGVTVRRKNGEEMTFSVPQPPDPWAPITDHFIDVLLGDAEPVCDGYDGQNCLLVMDAVRRSAREGRRIELE